MRYHRIETCPKETKGKTATEAHHGCRATQEEKVKFGSGRPAAGDNKATESIEYQLTPESLLASRFTQ